MTYCVGMRLKDGLVMLSDTRTNAGVDYVSSFGKMHVFCTPGERMICVLSAGNLAISQAVVNQLEEGVENEKTGEIETLYTVPTMFRSAQLVGKAVRQIYAVDGDALKAQDIGFDVSLLVGGQIAGRNVRLFNIYQAGNFIEATEETPYLQIGEHKYGKPILDRAGGYDIDLYDAAKLCLISMDSTIRSNLSVGPPIDLLVYRRDGLEPEVNLRIEESDPYFQSIRTEWSEALRKAYLAMPAPPWAKHDT